jgi:signal transduction histidine kinase/ActR/RegA family two-component response regulator
VHPDDQGRLKDFIASAFTNSQSTMSCEYRKRRFDGQYRWFSGQITQVSDIESGDISFLKTATDIHDRKMADERARVSQKLESLGQLTGGMAHDFNNLLAIIVGNLDLLKPNVKVEADGRRLDVAINAAQRGVGLVKSLLALASKQPLLPVTTDLGALAERILPLLKHAAGQRVNFELKLPSVGLPVEVDEAGLEAVLLNLTVNARDAMPKGGDLTLSLGVTGASASIVITDNGTGMPEAVLKRATEPFFTTKERGQGTGLGLSMVAGFVKQSNGTLKIQSVEGKGTTIEILLPLVRDTARAAIALHPSNAQTVPATLTLQSPPTANTPVTSTTGKYKILVVDDELELAELVRAWAKAQGHTVVLATSADDALTLLAVRTFDVLLTDIMMPGSMDGIGLAEKTSALYPAMKILLMSGYSKETATNRADVPWPLLVKPFGKDDFYAAIEKALGESGFAILA